MPWEAERPSVRKTKATATRSGAPGGAISLAVGDERGENGALNWVTRTRCGGGNRACLHGWIDPKGTAFFCCPLVLRSLLWPATLFPTA